MTEHWWATTSVMSGSLLTGYEQLNYYWFNRNLSISVSLTKDWFMLYKKFNQDLATYNFLNKKLIFVKLKVCF